MEPRKGMVMIFIIGLLVGFIIGFSFGAAQTAKFCVETAYAFLHLNGYEIDRTLIAEGLARLGLPRG